MPRRRQRAAGRDERREATRAGRARRARRARPSSGASPSCAMSARATRSWCRCRSATLTAADAEALRAAYETRLRGAVRAPYPGRRHRDPELVGARSRPRPSGRTVLGEAGSAPAPQPVGTPAGVRRPQRQDRRRAGLPPREAAAGQRLRRPRHRRRGRDIDLSSRPVLPRISMPPAVSSWTARTGEETMSQSNSVGLIDLQIMWNRLIAVVEEQAQTLMRTAFSPIVRECGDLSAGVFDLQGRMLAQAVTGTPGHVNSMAESVKHFLRHFPVETMKPGDAYITNDPVDGHRPSQRLRHHDALLPQRQAGRAVLLHQPSHGHRRHRLRPRRHRRVHGGALHPDAEAVRPGQGRTRR